MTLLPLLLLAATTADARFGLFVGSNAAAIGRETLQHAEDDAARMRSVFVELGGIADQNAISVNSPDARRLLDAINAVATRVAAAEDATFIFYYSGHADDRALLLGETEVSFVDLRRALEAVPAKLRLEIVDACRSGALTRTKSAKMGAPFAVRSQGSGEGRVVITSSAEWEDAQESDRLGGSFFTFHLASGLRGAADVDADGSVTLAEAYAYVYGRTVESTLATAAGPQHPTFRHDLRGRGEVVLTQQNLREAALLALSGGGDYLIVSGDSGRVAAEVRADSDGNQLSLRPGWYRVSKRTGSEVLEGSVHVLAGEKIEVDAWLNERVAHARLVRKGGRFASQSVQVFGGMRGPLGEGIEATPIARAAWVVALPWFSVKPRATFGFPSALTTPRLSLEVFDTELGAEVSKSLDFDVVSIGVGLAGDFVWFHQRDRTRREPSRDAFGFVAAAVATIETRSWNGFSAVLSGELDAYGYPATSMDRAPVNEIELSTVLTYRVLFGVGYEL
jgi:hypothetical protein